MTADSGAASTITDPEKAENVSAEPESKPKKGFFSFLSRNKGTDTKVEKTEEKADEEKKEPAPPPVSLFQLFRFATPLEITLNLVGLVFAAAAGAALPLMSLIFGNITEEFVRFQIALRGGPEEAIEEVAKNFRRIAALDASYLVYIGIGMLVCTYVYMLTWVYTGELISARVRSLYLRAILRQDVAFFDNVGAGEVATRISTDTHLVQQGISEKVALSVNFVAAFITGYILAYIQSPRLAGALTAVLPWMMMAGAIMNIFIGKYMKASLKHVADSGTHAEEAISTIRTAHAFGTQRVLAKLYDEFIDLSYQADYKTAVVTGGGLAILFFAIYSAYALGFSFGITLIRAGQVGPSEIVSSLMSILIGSFSLLMLAPELQAVTQGCAAAAKLYATIDRNPAIDSADPGGDKPESVTGEITFQGVDFSYPSRPTVPVLKNLSISFKAGTTSALVGFSGAGKSSVVSLVERFYDPAQGSVLFDGKDIKSLNLKWYRSQIGLVSQEPTLFGTSIKENVAHGLLGTRHENASEEEKTELIKAACVKANADGFISKLPEGYETLVGERGFLLSGGQKQRIAIARAIVGDPRVLLLDEATSALDTQSEGVVQNALDKAAAGRTTITIAHRLSTIKGADVIYVMGDGEVLEFGKHDELVSRQGAYSRLVQAQKLREADENAALNEQEQSSEVEEKKDIEKQLEEEIPLGRKNTSRSLASEILAAKEANTPKKKKDDNHPLIYQFKRFGALQKDETRNYVIGAFFAIITGLVYPAFGIVYAKGIDVFSIPRERQRFEGDRIALWMFLVSIASTVAIGFQNHYFAASAASLSAKLRKMSFKAILRQDIEFFDKEENSTGKLTSNLSENPQKINGLAGVTLGAIVQSIACLIASFVVGLIFVWKLALIAMACTPLLISAGYIRLRVVVLKDQQNKAAHESSAQVACEAAGAIRTVASLTREDDCCKNYDQSLDEPLRHSNRTAVWSQLFYAFSQSCTFWIIALVFWYGSVLVSRREYTLFRFFVGLMSTVFGAQQAGNVFMFVPDVSSAQGAGSDILKLIDSVPLIDANSDEGKKVSAEKTQGHIRLDNVHFRYPTRPGVRVLRGLTLEAQPGTYVALCGPSGNGKSTVIQLLERFYDPLSGTVSLDGEPINELNIQSYRQNISLVSQEPTLYAGTVRFNILLGAIKPENEVTQEEIEEACRKANILEFIQGLPEGFATQVGGKGSQLSGGQKQRIAIARALLRNPKVLLLDEATSALDSNSEKVVQSALDEAAKGRTTIAIAHRLSTIQNADRIYFIKEGRVSESGTHDQLLARRGDYYEYVQLQALSTRE